MRVARETLAAAVTLIGVAVVFEIEGDVATVRTLALGKREGSSNSTYPSSGGSKDGSSPGGLNIRHCSCDGTRSRKDQDPISS